MAHAKIYVYPVNWKFTTGGPVFVLLTYFEKLSRSRVAYNHLPKEFLQETVDHPSTTQPPEA